MVLNLFGALGTARTESFEGGAQQRRRVEAPAFRVGDVGVAALGVAAQLI
jgi:hypothetical protein